MIQPSASAASGTLLPSDHVKMLVELLQPVGIELARRWLAALLLVDREEREQVVATIERRIVELYVHQRSEGGAQAEPTSRSASPHTTPTLRAAATPGETVDPWAPSSPLATTGPLADAGPLASGAPHAGTSGVGRSIRVVYPEIQRPDGAIERVEATYETLPDALQDEAGARETESIAKDQARAAKRKGFR
ncbi:MAG: hypothetical protein SFZ23_14195 [Planctomycetota bacterium]|nr:hypothetical protein [Planctomycetota bacterium]